MTAPEMSRWLGGSWARLRRCASLKVDKSTGLRSDQVIVLRGPKTRHLYPAPLRRVNFYDTENKVRYVFLTNNFMLPARTRYYQCAFRAITTGHSNRRRTQIADFEAIELAFPPEPEEQRRLIAGITQASGGIRAADEVLRRELHVFSSVIDGRGDEELPETTGD